MQDQFHFNNNAAANGNSSKDKGSEQPKEKRETKKTKNRIKNVEIENKSSNGRNKTSSHAFAKSDAISQSNDTPTVKNASGRVRDMTNLDADGTPKNKRSGEDMTNNNDE